MAGPTSYILQIRTWRLTEINLSPLAQLVKNRTDTSGAPWHGFGGKEHEPIPFNLSDFNWGTAKTCRRAPFVSAQGRIRQPQVEKRGRTSSETPGRLGFSFILSGTAPGIAAETAFQVVWELNPWQILVICSQSSLQKSTLQYHLQT